MDDMTQERLKQLVTYDPETGEFTGNYFGNVIGYDHKPAKAKTTYRRIKLDGKNYSAHRMAWLYVHGDKPKEIDHRDRDGSNNRLDNLRVADRVLNNRNQGLMQNNKSGIAGVSKKHKKGRTPRWVANIGINGKLKEVGSSLDFFEACCKRKSAELYYGY